MRYGYRLGFCSFFAPIRELVTPPLYCRYPTDMARMSIFAHEMEINFHINTVSVRNKATFCVRQFFREKNGRQWEWVFKLRWERQ